MKFLGDGAMLRLTDATAGVGAALNLVEMMSGEGAQSSHAGVHVGSVIERDLDVFGQTVNLASRIEDVAGPGEVLASEAVAEASDDSSFGFERIEDAELKGPSRPGRPLPRHTDRVSDRPYFGLKPAERMVTVKRDPQQVQEWLRQRDLIYGGLIGVGIVMLQPFLTAPSLDLSAKICVVAFSVAIPLLAALVLVNRQESSAVV